MWPQHPDHQRAAARLLLGAWLLLCAGTGVAQSGFTGGVTPSRFELASEPGSVIRRSLKLFNMSDRPQNYRIKTVDWQYSEAGEISFQDALAPGSCRPWVRLEQHEVSVLPDPRRPRPYRFEVHVPEDAPPRECRLALMIESLDSAYTTQFANGAIELPIAGRIAVVVYLAIGDVAPELEIGDLVLHAAPRHGVLPAVPVRNVGGAHGRLDADLSANQASGESVELSIATSPVLPGQTRHLRLTPPPGTDLSYPLTITGRIYSEGKSIVVNQLIEQDIDADDPELIASQ